MLKDFDIVLIQELVAPPYADTFPDGSDLKPDAESHAFFDAMESYGFCWWLSEEDTGPGEANHTNATTTEWWVAFYKSDVVQTAPDLPWGFLASNRSRDAHYGRVPYAFSFRTVGGKLDFVLVSIHLHAIVNRTHQTPSEARARRREEMTSVACWIDANSLTEKDFAIVGDTNAQDCEELRALGALAPAGFASLNDNESCQVTNVAGDKPYDNAFVSESLRQRVDCTFGFRVGDLKRTVCSSHGSCPSSPQEFSEFYSDHDPVYFRLTIPQQDAD